jgi:hypothetical protein
VPDDATCRAVLDPKTFDLRSAKASIAAGRLAYDAEAAARCFQAVRAALCPAPPFADPSCAAIFVGQVASGGACASAADCRTGTACRMPVCANGCCLGMCQAAGPPITVTPAPLGAPCQNHSDCAADAYCDASDHCAQMPSEPGAPCLFGCTTGDLHCDPTTLRCVRYADLGAACATTPCNPSYAFCDGVCKARPGLGGACDDVRRCVGGTRCVGELCAARAGVGAPCATSDDCDYACDPSAGMCVGPDACTASSN